MANFKIAAEDRFPAQATSLSSHIGVVNQLIKQKLTDGQLDMFRRTVFGRFVDMDIVFNSPLVHHILLREVHVQNHNDETMYFNLNGHTVKFSKDEFLLVTGLWRSPVVVPRTTVVTGALRTKYFHDLRGAEIHPTAFEEHYKGLQFETDLDAVKVSLIYMYELGLSGKDKTKSNIDRSLLDDVDDLDFFNSRDWGSIIWERTFNGLQKALRDKVFVYKQKARANQKYVVKYNLPGFPHAFQVWAYETISTIVDTAAIRLNENAVPRFLRWACTYSLPNRTLQRDVFNSPVTVITPVLVLSDAERRYRDTPVAERAVYVDRPNEDRVPSSSLTGSDSSYSKERLIALEHHEERPIDPPVVSKRRRVERGEHDHTSLDDRVARVEEKVDAVMSDLDKVKSQLQTITTLLGSLCQDFPHPTTHTETTTTHPDSITELETTIHIKTTTTHPDTPIKIETTTHLDPEPEYTTHLELGTTTHPESETTTHPNLDITTTTIKFETITHPETDTTTTIIKSETTTHPDLDTTTTHLELDTTSTIIEPKTTHLDPDI